MAKILLAAFVFAAIGPGPASAVLGQDSGAPPYASAKWDQDKSRNQFAKKHKIKWKNGGCKYEYKADAKGFKEKYKCK